MADDENRVIEAKAKEDQATKCFKNVCGKVSGKKVTGAEHRAITLKELLQVKQMVDERCEKEKWVSFLGEKLTPEKVNLYDVNKYIILPVTVKRQCSFVEMVATGPRQPKWFVSHWWGEPIYAFIRCVQQHAEDHKLGEDTPYWICAYANNQWDLAGVNDELESTPFFKAMELSEGTLSILDTNGTVFTRIWCGYELYLSLAYSTDKKWTVYTTYEAFFKEPVMKSVGLTEGLAPIDDDGELKQAREKSFPIELLQDALNINIENAEASMEDDKTKILQHIGDDVEKLHAVLKGRFAAAALRLTLELNDNKGQEKMWLKFLKALEDSRARVLNLDFGGCMPFKNVKYQQHLRTHLPWDSLENLTLSFRKLDLDGKKITEMLKVWPFDKAKSVHLNLRFNIISSEGAKGIGEVLKRKTSTIRTLDLCECEIGDEGAMNIAAALEVNKSLQIIDLSSNDIGPAGAEKIAKALKKNKSLHSLNLASKGVGVNIGDEGVKKIAASLETNKKLQTLILKFNQIGDDEAESIAIALRKNTSLQTLDLDCNLIADEGAKKIAAALGVNKKLQTLRLGHNQIGDEGAIAIGKVLKKNKALETLHLDNNGIEDVGAAAIGKGLENNKTLRFLNLRKNYIADEGGEEIFKALKKNKSLKTLKMDFIDKSLFDKISEIMSGRR
uniref:Uncharacterized protein n=1 Tax=Aplanochytrium stocchinoi TaxID=215587 RepID=A0A6S8A2X7_9STRA|mmetsp:Transcript_27471/g.33586  ORF Transcript_27471/g.33586 Transcript_27471/m.33586 type:complete len:672 (+) Transcript_27471:250-2265(+)|eukprot:CAMPEP_0204863888 /NCGR_PEP_ID=MMETSP1348-20121228/3663_1 /ASSEMBLY_ACC=CAM_ASM_000700 /TAXON_ID=215587 /ORGANISM="Aplanochytrium stocchinoi, Strain GSBS06" /LENGTH=671 /DNA_ID=CAMNT_0052014353 /DNA_START=229 /DNA_END=2244 /DNA_ORIENTATION=+